MPRKKRTKTPPVEEAPTLRPPWHGFARVRIRLPNSDPPRYYNSDNNGRDNLWVTVGYTMWRTEEWVAMYSSDYKNGDIRNWEFFGKLIDIWEGTDPDHK